MPSSTTVFRAAVMLASGIIVVRGWQLYGPSSEQMKSLTARAMEIVSATWNESQQPAAPNASLTADAQGTAPPFAAPLQPATRSDTLGVPHSNPEGVAELSAPIAPPMFAPSAAEEPGLAAPDRMPVIRGDAAGRLPGLLARLEQLGGADLQLVEWGSSGQLYRFCCRAALADTPNYSQHFESVAAEPLVAVEEVLAKVEAWRAARRDEGAIR